MILAVGNINMDWICKVECLPEPDEKVNITQFDIYPGGAASNFAVCLARLGSHVALFSHVGDDAEGRKALNALTEEKVDTSRVIIEPKETTGFVIILVGPEGQTIKMRYRGANAKFSPKDITPALLEDVDIVYGASLTIPMAFQIAKVAEKQSIKTAIDVGGELLDQSKEAINQLLHAFSFVFMNEVVFKKITGNPPSKETVPDLLGGNLEIISVTCGSKGSFAATYDNVLHMPIYKVQVVDTTGAGDAYAAGFLHFYRDQIELEEVIKRAAACAALQITQYGGRSGLSSAIEIETFINEYKKSI